MADQGVDDHAGASPTAAISGWWHIRALLAEAAVLLILSRLLVGFVRFGRWRAALGHLAPPVGPGGGNADWPEPDDHDRYLARVVDRAATRLPFEFLCLPRAMALQWMLTRRGKRTTLVIGVLPGPLRGHRERGHLDDLHAWVELNGEVLIGASPEPYAILVRLQG